MLFPLPHIIAVALSAGSLFAGCDAELPSDSSLEPAIEARAPAIPPPGGMTLERDEEGLTLFANGARRSAILESLGELFGFEVVDEQGRDPTVRVHAVGVSLDEALGIALADTPYRVESEVDPFDGHRKFIRLIVAPEAADDVPPKSEAEKPARGVGRAKLLKELSDATAEERANSIWMIDPGHPDELDFLLRMLASDSDGRVRTAAATQLQLAAASEAIPALEAASSDPDPATAEAARVALERLITTAPGGATE